MDRILRNYPTLLPFQSLAAIRVPDRLCMAKYYHALGKKYHHLLIDMMARNGNLKVIKFFRSVGYDVPNGFDWAVQNGQLEMVRYLTECGFKGSRRARDMAAKNGHLHMVEYLHSVGMSVNQDTVYQAIIGGHLPIVRYCYQQGVPTYYYDMVAADNGDLEMIKDLYSMGCRITNSLVGRAASYGDLEMIKFFHSVVPDYTYFTIHLAAENGHTDVVKFLLSVMPQN